MTGTIKTLESCGITMAILLLAYLVEMARERGVLVQSFAVAFLVLVAVLIGVSVVWFKLVEMTALAH